MKNIFRNTAVFGFDGTESDFDHAMTELNKKGMEDGTFFVTRIDGLMYRMKPKLALGIPIFSMSGFFFQNTGPRLDVSCFNSEDGSSMIRMKGNFKSAGILISIVFLFLIFVFLFPGEKSLFPYILVLILWPLSIYFFLSVWDGYENKLMETCKHALQKINK